MALNSLFRAVRSYDVNNSRDAYQANNDKLLLRFQDVVYRTWHLGFTSFGGPPVHFQILYQKFVDGVGGKTPWIDEQTYQELFGLNQALPGPASTKMLFSIAMIHAGIVPALIAFALWSLPGAIGMYGLSLGVQQMDEVLPDIVYALLSGLNASTVGIVALAAVQLAEKCIKDPLTRILVIMGGCAGLCYNALWYFPLLLVIGGLTTAFWDLLGRRGVSKVKGKLRRRRSSNPEREAEESSAQPSIPLTQQPTSSTGLQKRSVTSQSEDAPADASTSSTAPPTDTPEPRERQAANTTPTSPNPTSHRIPVKVGVAIIALFIAAFIAIIVARGVLPNPTLEYNIFSNMFLAGTIIFGGGPVVIPLLRDYVVDPGWVSPRDFLIGLAIIQAFPGPNFNFAVYLGALAFAGGSSSYPSILGAILGFIGIFLPGLTLAVGFQSIWRVLRKSPITTSVLRGMNATAVGLVFTAVYRLWQIGYLSSDATSGQSLAKEPFWLVVTALTYAENAWFKVPPPVAILMGAVLGLCWYGAVGR
ncbi:hypothetical protein AJ80_04264 [Polytolypa hystricis UAMH7299]|uniref:Chromate ion transporter n=1 Tax=Polytolypa hystricis (strain UAMH7299) TaxID=1447883 RepID=A0A2B7YEA1_POLH7|nr:hypothetical protein AJ80_04264 [Polytolypa hystricis UAMH7299]